MPKYIPYATGEAKDSQAEQVNKISLDVLRRGHGAAADDHAEVVGTSASSHLETVTVGDSSWHEQASTLSCREERAAGALDAAGASSPSLRALRALAMSATLMKAVFSLSLRHELGREGKGGGERPRLGLGAAQHGDAWERCRRT
nr:unnamed protein product [Digitaria exilis]